jgi:penicillin-binding protein 1A
VSDWFFREGGRDRLINWLGVDAWLDSSVSESWERFKDRYNAASSWFARFRLTGWQRAANEFASEAVTLAAGGAVLLYALALPAFLEIDEAKFLSTGKYSVRFLDKDGNEIGKRGINLDDAVPLDEIPAHLIQATLATEDRRFFEHFGVDFVGTTRAIMTNLQANEVLQGGSTITQQLAKNLFLSSERSIRRKIKEVFLSFWLESRLTKQEILKLYLDRAYMGGGAVGVEAAAQFYFGKSVRNITLAEAALMAGLYKAPTKFAPHVNLPASRARANDVLSNLVEAGYYTAGQVHQARLNPARPIENRRTNSPDWFLDWAYEEIQRVMDGKGHYVLTARTTVDMRLQQAADQALVSTIGQFGRSHNARAGAVVSMEPDGAVRALVGGTDYGESQFNRATQAKRQPGSSFKLYVYAAALENGFTSSTAVSDSAPPSCGPRGWQPKNYDGGSGSGRRLTLQDAFKVSLNTVATDLSLYKLGPNSRDKVIELTERLGVQGVKKTCSMALGDTGISPLEHTGAYAVYAHGGRSARPYAILEVYNSKNEIVYAHEKDAPPATQIVRRAVAEQMNQMMQAVVTEGTGRRATLDFTHSVGKTGTSSSYRDAWFLGFTGQYVTGVWIGNDDFRPMYIESSARTGNATGVTGGGLPAQTWQAFMTVAHTNMSIPTIPGLPPHPTQVAEQQRLADLKRNEPGVAVALQAQQQAKRNQSIMPDLTRDALKKVARAMRRATGSPEPDIDPPAPASPAGPPKPGAPQGAAPPERRAEGNVVPEAVPSTSAVLRPSSAPLAGPRQPATR